MKGYANISRLMGTRKLNRKRKDLQNSLTVRFVEQKTMFVALELLSVPCRSWLGVWHPRRLASSTSVQTVNTSGKLNSSLRRGLETSSFSCASTLNYEAIRWNIGILREKLFGSVTMTKTIIFVISPSKPARDFYFLYELKDGKFVKLGKDKSPIGAVFL